LQRKAGEVKRKKVKGKSQAETTFKLKVVRRLPFAFLIFNFAFFSACAAGAFRCIIRHPKGLHSPDSTPFTSFLKGAQFKASFFIITPGLDV
jgi:hypothetical protein